MPVCSRPFHHACAHPRFSTRPPPSPPFFRSSFSACLSPSGYVPDFRCHCRFRPLAPACAALVCICVSILRPFFSHYFAPFVIPTPYPGNSFVTIGIRMPPPHLASHFSQLMYQFLIAPPLISYQRSILCHVPSTYS